MQDTSKPADHRTQWLSTFSLRLTGYVLLALSALDIAATIFPPNFFNERWEFETIGRLVERVPVPLIGLSLVFYGGLRYRRPLEKLCLRPLAWLAIAAGVGYLLLILPVVTNGLRIHNTNQIPQVQQLDQQLQQVKQVEQRIRDAAPEQVNALVKRLNLSLPSATQSPSSDLKAAALLQLQQNQTALQKARQVQKQNHFKTVLKWGIGALLSGVCLIYLGMGANKYFLLGLN